MIVPKWLLYSIVIISECIYGCDALQQTTKQIKIGNFALPDSQQPVALFGFGQHIVEQHDLLLGIYPSFFIGHNNRTFSELVPTLTYGIRDNVTLVVVAPFALRLTDGINTSAGLEDWALQLEYSPYIYETKTSDFEVRLVGSLILPFGNVTKNPETGFGSPTFFLGLVLHYLSTDWYCYLAPGGFFTTPYNKNRIGNKFLYQTGFGKNLGYETDKWICTIILELSGIYSQKSKICGVLDPNSGGNTILLGPSLWFSTERFIFQAGIAPVIYEQVNGEQSKDTLLIALNFEWKF